MISDSHSLFTKIPNSVITKSLTASNKLYEKKDNIMEFQLKHNKTVEQIKKMSTQALYKLYAKVAAVNMIFSPFDIEELEEERQMMTAVVASYGPEQNVVSNDQYREAYWTSRENQIKGQQAEEAAAVPGWKRNWIRNLRYNGKGASWSMIMELTGLSENMVFNIAKGKIYRWDFDSEAKIVATQGKQKVQLDFSGHVQNELDVFFG